MTKILSKEQYDALSAVYCFGIDHCSDATALLAGSAMMVLDAETKPTNPDAETVAAFGTVIAVIDALEIEARRQFHASPEPSEAAKGKKREAQRRKQAHLDCSVRLRRVIGTLIAERTTIAARLPQVSGAELLRRAEAESAGERS